MIRETHPNPNFFPVFGSTCTVGLPRSVGSPVSGSTDSTVSGSVVSVVSVGLGGSTRGSTGLTKGLGGITSGPKSVSCGKMSLTLQRFLSCR